MVTLIAFIALIGYIYIIPVHAKANLFTSEAIHTAFCFLLLGISTSLAVPDEKFTMMFIGDQPGNVIGKRLFNRLIAVFLLIGYVIMAAFRKQNMSGDFGIAILMVSSIVVTLFIIQSSVSWLNKVYHQKTIAEKETIRINEDLKKTIVELNIIRNELTEKLNELESTNKALESFNFVTSHDLREPLRKIKNFVELYIHEEKEKIPEKGLSYLKRVLEIASGMQYLIRDLLEYGKIKRVEEEFEKTAFNKLIGDDILKEFEKIIEEKQINISYDSTCEIHVIPHQIRQLMIHLINNSIKFAAPERKLKIEIRCHIKKGKTLDDRLLPDKNYCHISFRDNGIGFDSKYSEKIFQIFQRLDPEKYQGTGIGLAICKKIVEVHHGIITATGELNKGAQFDIYLPDQEEIKLGKLKS